MRLTAAAVLVMGLALHPVSADTQVVQTQNYVVGPSVVASVREVPSGFGRVVFMTSGFKTAQLSVADIQTKVVRFRYWFEDAAARVLLTGQVCGQTGTLIIPTGTRRIVMQPDPLDTTAADRLPGRTQSCQGPPTVGSATVKLIG